MTVVRKNRQPVTDHRIKRYCCFEQILLNFAETRAEVLHDLTIVRTLRGFHSFSFLIAISRATRFTMQASSCRLVFARKFGSPKNVFDCLANRILSHEREQSLRMLTPNCNFQF